MRSDCRSGKSLSSLPDNISLVKDLKAQGWLNENQLEPAEFLATGRGVFSKHAIGTDENLIELPFDALITLATLEKDLEFKALFDNTKVLKAKLPTQSLLAIYILYRQHHHPTDAYIRSIPVSFNHPYFCTKQELLILPDNLFERIHEQSKQINTTLALIASALGETVCACCSLQYIADIFTPAALKWAFFAVNSRSVFIDPYKVKRICPTKHFADLLSDKPNIALAPFLDLLNHSDTVATSEPEFFVPRDTTDTAQLTYKLCSTASYRPYDQIFISYGTLDNTRLLLEYGFILRDNAHDCVRLDMTDVAAFLEANARHRKPINSNKFRFIKENQLDVEMFVCRTDGLSHNLTVVLTILFVEVAHFNNVLSIVGFGDVQPLEPIALSARNLLLHKRSRLDATREALCGKGVDPRSESGSVVMEYLVEGSSIIDHVLDKFLNQ